MERRFPGWALVRSGRHGEAALLLACLGLLFWLESRPAVSSDAGYLGSALLSLVAALAAVWLAPGYVLWRLSSRDRTRPWWEAVPFTFAFGLAWLFVPACLAMVRRSDMATLTQVVLGANAVLTFAYLALRRPATPAARPAEGEGDPGAGTWPSLWLLAAALLAVGRALSVSTMRPYRFTGLGDEWAYMKAIRRFLESAAITDPDAFDVWDLVLALVFRLSGLEVIGAYRRLLAPLLILFALAALLALARRVLGNANGAWLALTLLLLYGLSDMYTRGEGAGMGLLVRITEDKYVCLFIALPLAQLSFLEFLDSGSRSALGICGALTLAATLLQPFAVAWLAFSCGAVFLSGLVTRRVRVRPRLLLGVGLTLVCASVLAFWLRSLRPTPYFRLYDPMWDYNAVLLESVPRQLLVLSLEKGWYMVHPWQVRHPFVIAALFGSLLLLRSFGRSLERQFLVLSALLPTLLVFNPVTAPIVGSWVTPWRLHWLLWIVPTPLILGALLHEGLAGIEGGVRRRWALPAGRLIGGLGFLVLAALALALQGRMADSLRNFKTKNDVLVKKEERDFMRLLCADRSLVGRVLAPAGPSIRMAAWTTRLQPVLSFEVFRSRLRHVIDPAQEFLAASSAGPRQIDYLKANRVDYVMAETGSPIERAMRSQPGPFRLLHSNPLLSLYAWRPQYWSALPAP